MAHIRCDFIQPIRFKDQLILQMWVKDIGIKSFSFEYRLIDIFDESKVYATGESTQVCYDYEKNRSIEVPAEMRESLTQYLMQ